MILIVRLKKENEDYFRTLVPTQSGDTSRNQGNDSSTYSANFYPSIDNFMNSIFNSATQQPAPQSTTSSSFNSNSSSTSNNNQTQDQNRRGSAMENTLGFMQNLFGDVARAANTASNAFTHSYPGNYSANRNTSRGNPYPRAAPLQPLNEQTVPQRTQSTSSSQSSASTTIPAADTSIPRTTYTGYTPSPSSSPSRGEEPIPIPTIESLIINKIDPNTLQIKLLKQILVQNSVTLTRGPIEKPELVNLVANLISTVKKERMTADSLDDEELCKICCDNPVNCVILECGHLVVCLDCGKKLMEGSKECPICRRYISKLVRTFRS